MAMKVVFALLALIAFSQAASNFYWFAGSTTTNATGLTGSASLTATYVSSFTGGTCTPGAIATGYQKFTINATTSAFWYITALVEHSSLYGAQLQIYNGAFDPAAPCTRLMSLRNSYSSDAPHFSDLFWLTPGTYDVVITASDLQYNGLFAVHADSSFQQHITTSSDNWSEIPSQSTTSCSSYGSAPYTYFTIPAPYTGNFDIFFFAYNATVSTISATATLYNGTVTFLGTGNESVPADPCAGQPWAQSIYGYSTYTDVSKSYYDAGAMMAVSLNGGQNYTLHVTSYYSDEINNYGVWWRPSIVFQMGNTANYYPPSLSGGFFDAATEECTPVDSAFLWNSHTFSSMYSTVVVDVGASPGFGFDERTCIYVGNNSGTPFTVAPNNCTGVVQCGDSGSGDPVAAAGLVGNTFTVVEMPYYSGTGDEGDNYALWVYSGVQLGPSPAPISSTTGESSTSSAATQIAALVLIVAAMLF